MVTSRDVTQCVLTAFELIRSIATVVNAVTQQLIVDTRFVVTRKLGDVTNI